MAETNQCPERMELEELLALLAPLGAGQPTPPALLERLGALREIVRDELLPQMKELTLSPGFLERLAESCPRLTRLDLPRTDLAELSPLARLKELQLLGLTNTQVQDLSPLAGLSRLQFLSLNNTQVRDLSPLAGLKELQTLSLTNTQVQNFSPLAGLTGLQSLYLDNTQVQDLSPLAGLTGLHTLSLDNTQVQDFSPLAGLTGLQSLSLDNTQVRGLSPLAGLGGLQWLSLSNTQVQDLSPLTELKELQSLYLQNTQVRELSPLAGLKELQWLNLNSTQVRDLSPLAGLKELLWLVLANTQVRDLSPLAGLERLQMLWLNGLHLDRLPRFCVREGLGLVLEGTVFTQQPEALFRLSTKQILATYYDQPLVKINEGKVIFLGDSGVGKTYTIRRILARGVQKNYHTDSTPGVDIQPYACGDGTRIRFWDFGGQEIMQSMHRCFLTERSCYVVVVSNRDPSSPAMAQARRWLRTIAGFSERVSVLLAVNQWHNVAEERNIDVKELREICPKLTEVIFYSAVDDSEEDFNRRITEALRREAARLDSIRLELPESWAAIRGELLELKENYITLEKYRRICEKHGLTGNDENAEAIRMWLLEWFNDMGVCFSYHKNAPSSAAALRDYKVLQPKWLTNGIYRIIDNGHNRSAGGILTRKDLSQLLNSDEYKAVDPSIHYDAERDQRYILEVMRKFGRSYPLDEDREFVPETLPGKRPEHPVPPNLGIPLVYTLKLRYLPISLLHRLMIAMLDRIVLSPWRGGALFQDEEDAMLAEALPEEGELRLSVYRTADHQNHFCALFHEARTLLLRCCREMRLVTEAETLSLARAGCEARYALSSLVSRWYRTQGDRDFPMPATKGDADFPLGELLLPLFPPQALDAARFDGGKGGSSAADDLYAVCAVWPWATRETLERLPEEIWKRFSRGGLEASYWDRLFQRPIPSAAELDYADRLRVLALLYREEASFPDWLAEKGVLQENHERRTDPMLKRPMISGVNADLLVWAEDSPLYRLALGDEDPDREQLYWALGPSESNCYAATFALTDALWRRHPELGLGPDYRLLAEKEYGRDYYNKYRDHCTHMFKVYLLGLYLYEKQRALHEALQSFFAGEADPDRAFLSVWTLAALYHDMGYLIETEDGSRDSEAARFVYARLTEALALPLTRLYPRVFGLGTEAGQQKALRKKNLMIPAVVETLLDLEEKLELLKGFGPGVGLCVEPDGNPLKAYYAHLPKLREGRSYYDHGVVSACILLFVRDALVKYVQESREASFSEAQRAKLQDFLAGAADYSRWVELAARAIALHNVKKDFNAHEALELNQKGVTIGDFRIPLDREPVAYLLRLCDELQCWDRKRFDVPEDYIFSGDKLSFNTDMGKVSLSVFDPETRSKLRDALEGFLEPPARDCVELV